MISVMGSITDIIYSSICFINHISYYGGMGRPPLYSQNMQARFRAGTFERIEAVLADGEDRTDFVRAAVDAEIQRRQRKAARDSAEG